jgi:hypothetical protein
MRTSADEDARGGWIRDEHDQVRGARVAAKHEERQIADGRSMRTSREEGG